MITLREIFLSGFDGFSATSTTPQRAPALASAGEAHGRCEKDEAACNSAAKTNIANAPDQLNHRMRI